MTLSKNEKKIQKEREQRYGGNTTFNHKNLGIIWTGILQSYFRIKLPGVIPAHVILLMFAASKINRAVSEAGILIDDDNYDDGKIYMELAKNAKKESKILARKMSTKRPKEKKSNSNST